MSGDALGVEDLKPVHVQKIFQTMERIVSQVFVVNRVVLNGLQKTHQIVGFGNESAFFIE